jgi:hypothetical protein
MGVGVASIVVINCDPVETCAEIVFHLRHEGACAGLKIAKLGAIFS